MDKYVYINTDAFKEAIRRNGFNLREMSRMFDKNSSYISYTGTLNGGGRIEREFLEKVCLVIREKPESFILAEAEEKAEKAEKEAHPGSDMQAEIASINDAMASLVRMMETTMNTVKRISDEVSTIKDTEYAASQESKRFYQEGHATFRTIISWIKAGWKQ
jgi:hypothetical protein